MPGDCLLARCVFLWESPTFADGTRCSLRKIALRCKPLILRSCNKYFQALSLFYLSFFLSLSLSVYLSVCLSLSFCHSVSLSITLSLSLSHYLSLYHTISLYITLSLSLSLISLLIFSLSLCLYLYVSHVFSLCVCVSYNSFFFTDFPHRTKCAFYHVCWLLPLVQIFRCCSLMTAPSFSFLRHC